MKSFFANGTILALAAMFCVAAPAAAQGPAQTPEKEPILQQLPCGAGLVQYEPHRAFRLPAAAPDTRLAPGQLRIDYPGHSTFLITSPEGVKVETDYNDFHRADVVPDIVTMSGWHPNHATLNIEPGITHVLRGYHMGNGGVSHDVRLKDVRAYSVAVNINGAGATYQWPSSVFVIQSGGLCVAHLGLVAHVLHPQTVKDIGKIDVLMTPVYGFVTQTIDEIFRNIELIGPKVVIPMHYDREETVENFLAYAAQVMPVRRAGANGFVADKATLPKKTEVYYLFPPGFGTTL